MEDPRCNEISDEIKDFIRKALLESNSLAGLSRIFGVSKSWLMGFIKEVYAVIPDDLGVKLGDKSQILELHGLEEGPREAEAAEIWSFVGNKSN